MCITSHFHGSVTTLCRTGWREEGTSGGCCCLWKRKSPYISLFVQPNEKKCQIPQSKTFQNRTGEVYGDKFQSGCWQKCHLRSWLLQKKEQHTELTLNLTNTFPQNKKRKKRKCTYLRPICKIWMYFRLFKGLKLRIWAFLKTLQKPCEGVYSPWVGALSCKVLAGTGESPGWCEKSEPPEIRELMENTTTEPLWNGG